MKKRMKSMGMGPGEEPPRVPHPPPSVPPRAGSVVVNYKVLLQPPAGDQANASLGQRTRELLEASNAAIQPQNCTEGAGGCWGA